MSRSRQTPLVVLLHRILRTALDVLRPRLGATSLAALLALLIAPAAPAATPPELPPLVERALKTMEGSDQDDYAFRMTTTEGGSTTVATLDPAKPEGQMWTLVQKDGKAPSAKEQEAFRKQRTEQDKKGAQRKESGKSEKKGDDSLREMIAPSSLQLLSETADRASYRFKMRADDEDAKAFAEAIRGTLVISKAAPHVESIDLASTGEIKPMTGVKFSEFHLTLTFLPPDAQGNALPATIHAVVKGRAMLLKKLDQETKINFSDYVRRPAPATTTR